jgi:D-alanyl-D-alanine carboxypeptidase
VGQSARRIWGGPRAAIATALVIVLAGGAACGSSTSSTSSGSPSKTLSSSTTSQLDKAVPQAMSQEGVPGAIVGYWSPNGNYVKTFGVADTATRSPMQQNFYQRIGSITKTFTVTAVLQLVDQGKLSLDDPISKYRAGVPNGDQITIRQLAAMQSGLYNYTNDEAGFQATLMSNPFKQWTPDEVLAIAFSKPPDFPPGKGFAYCNTNTVLLGLVVEKVTGQPLNSYLQQNVLKPLNMNHSALPVGNEFPNPHAQGYKKGQNATDWNPSWAGAAGAMYSNLDDMRTWAPALAKGTLVKPSTQAQRLQAVPFKEGPPGSIYGLGIINMSGWIGHGGNLPGYNSIEAYLPSQQATLVIFTNTDTGNHPMLSPNLVLGNVVTKIVSPTNVIAQGFDNET